MKISDNSLVGRVVISGDGIAIGEVARIVVDTTDWRVETLQIALRKESAERIGLSHGVFRAAVIEIATSQIQSVGDAVVLGVAVDQLRAPEATPGESAQLH
jgi:sporulation protein YlmC with PRC-barrel domain